MQSNGRMTDDVSEVLIVTSVCLGAREALSKKSHVIGQTPCLYERHVVSGCIHSKTRSSDFFLRNSLPGVWLCASCITAKRLSISVSCSVSLRSNDC